MSMLILATMTVSAVYWPHYEYSDVYWYSRPEYSRPDYSIADRSTSWTASPDAYELHVPLRDVDAHSLSAALSADGKKIEITGEKQIEGCTCRPTTVKEIGLPYRPRAEDVDIIAKDGLVSLRLARHSSSDTPTPLAVKMTKDVAAPLQTDKETQSKDKEAQSRQLRFVPHESAGAPSSLAQREKSLTDKFRSAALATVATSRLEESAAAAVEKEAAGASATPSNVEAAHPSATGEAKDTTEQTDA